MVTLRYLVILTLLAFIAISCVKEQQSTKPTPETTTFILVRHAEKADDNTEDPPLNKIGQERANALTDHLKETNITAIYSTSYKRTMHTVQQIADAKGLMIKTYDPFADSVMVKMLKNESGGTVLISGHSNTTPMLVNKLIGKERYQQFDDSDYDNLFIVMSSKIGRGTVVKLTF